MDEVDKILNNINISNITKNYIKKLIEFELARYMLHKEKSEKKINPKTYYAV